MKYNSPGVLAVYTKGDYALDTVYSDLDIPLIESLDIEQPHRKIDVTVVQADEEGTNSNMIRVLSDSDESRLRQDVHSIAIYDIWPSERSSCRQRDPKAVFRPDT